MITLYVEAPYATFRKSFARSYAETYRFPPPATIYGMLLSLVGERFRSRHEGVRMAFAFRREPKVATTLRKLSRYRYGVPNKQSELGNAPDYIETVCGIEFLCWIDSAEEKGHSEEPTLEQRIVEALERPEMVDRYGLVYLGLSDDLVNDISLCPNPDGAWHRLIPVDDGSIELPVWVNHVSGIGTEWRRFNLERTARPIDDTPGTSDWPWVKLARAVDA